MVRHFGEKGLISFSYHVQYWQEFLKSHKLKWIFRKQIESKVQWTGIELFIVEQMRRVCNLSYSSGTVRCSVRRIWHCTRWLEMIERTWCRNWGKRVIICEITRSFVFPKIELNSWVGINSASIFNVCSLFVQNLGHNGSFAIHFGNFWQL